jgi:hypothetical protein
MILIFQICSTNKAIAPTGVKLGIWGMILENDANNIKDIIAKYGIFILFI